jgi:hypothetical protein
MKNIKTFIAAAVIALTAACDDQVTEPAPVDVGSNPADRDHSEQGPHAPESK